MLDTDAYHWREVLVNITLSLALTLKVTGVAPSLNTFDFLWGMGIYSFFCANYATGKDTWADFE